MNVNAHGRLIVEIVLPASGLLEGRDPRLSLAKTLDCGEPFESLDDLQARFLGKRLGSRKHSSLLGEHTRLPSHVEVKLLQGLNRNTACLRYELS